MAHVVKLAEFEGPLDLLLRLCEEEKFDLSRVSLASVCDDYLATIRVTPLDPHALADFFLVASKLLLLKAEGMMPGMTDEKEREDAYALEDQLKLLARYVAAGRGFERLWRQGPFAFAPARSPILVATFSPPPKLQAHHLGRAFQTLIGVLAPFLVVSQSVLRRVLSLEQKFNELKNRIALQLETRFSEIIGPDGNREELIVSFLALLELVKQQLVSVAQTEHFGDILIKRTHAKS